MDFSPIAVIEKLAIARLAYIEAKREVLGMPTQLHELMVDRDGDKDFSPSSNVLFKRLKLNYAQGMEREQIDYLRDQLGKGYPISDFEREWLKKRTSPER